MLYRSHLALACAALLGAAGSHLTAKSPQAAPAPPPRLVLAFYYTWSGTPMGPAKAWRHWDEGGHDPERRDERGWEELCRRLPHPLEAPLRIAGVRVWKGPPGQARSGEGSR